jgi:hypothetical protein
MLCGRGVGSYPLREVLERQEETVKVWVVLDLTEWTRDVIGVFASRDAALRALERTTSWDFSIEQWNVEAA